MTDEKNDAVCTRLDEFHKVRVYKRREAIGKTEKDINVKCVIGGSRRGKKNKGAIRQDGTAEGR